MPPSVKVQLKQPFGSLYGPPDENPGRYDFVPDYFAGKIDAFGYRLLWTRAAKCPCIPPDPQLEQASSICTLCGGSGYYYFGPGAGQDLSQEKLSDVQKTLIAASNPMMIRGVLQSIRVTDKDYEQWGSFRYGDAVVTVRFENRLAYRDRLVAIDIAMVQQEIVMVPPAASGPVAIPIRYFISGAVFVCRSVDKVFQPDFDFYAHNGKLFFKPGHAPAAGTRLAVNYETFPTYVVDTMPHARRVTNVLGNTSNQTSPMGQVTQLPIQAGLRLENLAFEQNG